ncbi:MAG: hypothetical protein BGO49_19920 [Planctomycetales bacterium 71-10]|nr:MAG: hypothetical protein BGO49_19920 [Planctomycetales bacterium 71-10]
MATARQEIPTLDDLLDAVLDRLSAEVVASLAAMRKPGRPKKGETLADQLVRMTQAKAKLRIDKSGPLPDEPDFNEETRKVIEDARAGKNLTRYESLDDFFAAHGL